MKPQPPVSRGAKRPFPATDFFFQSDLSNWGGAAWPSGDDDSPAHRFNELNREFLRESRRERKCEVIVFGFVMLVAAWAVLYMVYSVITLLFLRHPLGF